MIEKYAAPLILVREMGRLSGKTRFQKLACLLEARARQTSVRIGFSFRPYLHGPYSSELARMVDQLVSEGLLQETAEVTSSGNIRYSYQLTQSGIEALDAFVGSGLVSSSFVDAAKDVVEEARALPLPDLVERAYSAYEEIGE